MQIIEAKRKDINSVVKLNKELAGFHRKIDKYYKPGRETEVGFKKWLLKNFGKRNFKVFIAKHRGKIIGFGIASIGKAKPYCVVPKIGYLKNLYIKKRYRGQGIGKQTFKKFLEWFKKRDIKYIELSVDSRNRIGVSAYRKYGFFEYQKKDETKLII